MNPKNPKETTVRTFDTGRAYKYDENGKRVPHVVEWTTTEGGDIIFRDKVRMISGRFKASDFVFPVDEITNADVLAEYDRCSYEHAFESEVREAFKAAAASEEAEPRGDWSEQGHLAHAATDYVAGTVLTIADGEGNVLFSFEAESVTYDELEDLTKDTPTIAVFEDGKIEIDMDEITAAIRSAIAKGGAR